MAKELPRKYGEIAAMPAPPSFPDQPLITDAKTINGKPSDDPLGKAFENFHRALRERKS
jgi:hypothetical protein